MKLARAVWKGLQESCVCYEPSDKESVFSFTDVGASGGQTQARDVLLAFVHSYF